MSSIVGAITGGGGSGMGWHASSGDIINPFGSNQTAIDQAQAQYGNAQMGLAQQQDFLKALQAQNGIQNQSNVFNQLQGVANGTGPNPAQAQLANATGANVANQAALMAGQRGSSQNVGMIGRQAAQQGAATQQQSAGQAAALQAQQSLNALGQMGAMAGQQVGQQAAATGAYTSATQNEQSAINNAIAQQNNANVGMASNMNTANAAIQGQVAGAQANLVGGLMNGIGGGLLAMAAEGGKVEKPGMLDTLVSNVKSAFDEPVRSPHPKPAPTPNPEKAKPFSNVFGGNYADGGPVQFPDVTSPATARSRVANYFQNNVSLLGDNSPASQQNTLAKGSNQMGQAIGKGIRGLFSNSAPAIGPMAGGAADMMSMTPAATMLAAEGGKVPALVSPGEKYLTPKDVKKVEKGANPLEVGEKIPGKPKHKGNDYRNDTVPKELEEGGIVLPNSVMQAKHPHWAAHAFVSAIMAREGKKLPKKGK